MPEDEFKDLRNVSAEGLNPYLLEKGFSKKNFDRIVFRLNHVEKTLRNKSEILREGNVSSLEAEIYQHLGIQQDLIDICREMATLIQVSLQQEQGVAPPPNDQA